MNNRAVNKFDMMRGPLVLPYFTHTNVGVMELQPYSISKSRWSVTLLGKKTLSQEFYPPSNLWRGAI